MRVGLITNPASSKDVRRLVALARVVTAEEKANVIARFLTGLGAMRSITVHALDDAGGIARRAIRLAGSRGPSVEWLPILAEGAETDTLSAAAMLSGMGPSVVAVVGGDGTTRAAVEAWPDITLLPLAAGTNNAFAQVVEPTVAGLAVSYLDRLDLESVSRRRLRLTVGTQEGPATAVVDVVGVTDAWTGGRALWRPDDLSEAVVTVAGPEAVGMAGVAAVFGPLRPGSVRHLRFGTGRRVTAVFGPGLVIEVDVAHVDDIPAGRPVTLGPQVRVLALDGERRTVADTRATVVASPGPRSFDPILALADVYGPTPTRDLLP